jgi:hypothetical protein
VAFSRMLMNPNFQGSFLGIHIHSGQMLSCMSRCLEFRQDNVIRTELGPQHTIYQLLPGWREPSGIQSKTLTNHDIPTPLPTLYFGLQSHEQRRNWQVDNKPPNGLCLWYECNPQTFCVLAKFIRGGGDGFQKLCKIRSFICIAWLLAFCRATMNQQHRPVHHEGWMISDQETIFCWVPVH